MGTVDQVVRALHAVIDPEIGVNVVDLGLVYGITVGEDDVEVLLAMTSPTCPLSEYLVEAAERTIAERVPGVRRVAVAIVAAPPWAPEMMSDEARRLLAWER
jgi:metal-sulfur cluster biosynthetic enzyme